LVIKENDMNEMEIEKRWQRFCNRFTEVCRAEKRPGDACEYCPLNATGLCTILPQFYDDEYYRQLEKALDEADKLLMDCEKG